jgi:hypothetical protein
MPFAIGIDFSIMLGPSADVRLGTTAHAADTSRYLRQRSAPSAQQVALQALWDFAEITPARMRPTRGAARDMARRARGPG